MFLGNLTTAWSGCSQRRSLKQSDLCFIDAKQKTPQLMMGNGLKECLGGEAKCKQKATKGELRDGYDERPSFRKTTTTGECLSHIKKKQKTIFVFFYY